MHFRKSKTAAGCLSFVCYALFYTIIGPTMQGMLVLYQCTYESLSLAYALKSLGILGGAFSGGKLMERYPEKADLLMGLIHITGAVTGVLIPVLGHLYLLSIDVLIQGLVHGMLCSGATALIVRMWGDESAGPLLLTDTGFWSGTVIAPLIVSAFLTVPSPSPGQTVANSTTQFPIPDWHPKPERISNATGFLKGTTTSLPGTTTPPGGVIPQSVIDTADNLWIPFFICGCLEGLMALAYFLFYKFHPEYAYTEQQKIEKANKQEAYNSICPRKSLFYFLILLQFILFFLREQSLVAFAVSIAVQPPISLSPASASLVLALANVMAFLGTLVAFVCNRCIHVGLMVMAEEILLVLICIVLAAWGFGSAWLFSICLNIIMVLCGPLYGSLVACTTVYFDASSFIIGTIYLGMSIGMLLGTVYGAYVFQNHGALALGNVWIVCSILMLLLLVPMEIGMFRARKRGKAEEEMALEDSATESESLNPEKDHDKLSRYDGT